MTPRMHCVLYHALGGEFSQIQLADQCALDKTTMVVTMDALEKAGLAERRPSPTDRRARIIAVTDEGRGARGAADAIVSRLYADVLETLPADVRDVFVGVAAVARRRPPRRPAEVRTTGAAAPRRLVEDRLLTDHLLRCRL